jgi:hypothetical protein
MKLRVNIAPNKVVKFTVEYSDTVADLKADVKNYTGIEVSHQNLFFAGSKLNDTKNFTELGITEGATIILDTTF